MTGLLTFSISHIGKDFIFFHHVIEQFFGQAMSSVIVADETVGCSAGLYGIDNDGQLGGKVIVDSNSAVLADAVAALWHKIISFTYRRRDGDLAPCLKTDTSVYRRFVWENTGHLSQKR